MITWGRIYWPVFLIACAVIFVVGFGIPEMIALLTQRSAHTDNTLSNYAWQELHVTATVNVHTVAWWLTFIPWCWGIAILTLHIWYHQFG